MSAVSNRKQQLGTQQSSQGRKDTTDASLERSFFYDKALAKRENQLERMSQVIGVMEADFKRKGVQVPWASKSNDQFVKISKAKCLMDTCNLWDVERGLECLDESLARCETRIDQLHGKVQAASQSSRPETRSRRTCSDSRLARPAKNSPGRRLDRSSAGDAMDQAPRGNDLENSRRLQDAIGQDGHPILQEMIESLGTWGGFPSDTFVPPESSAAASPQPLVDTAKIKELEELLEAKNAEIAKLKSTIDQVNALCALESKNMDLRNFVKQLPEVRRKNVELKTAAAEVDALAKDNKRLQTQIDSHDAAYQQNINLKKRLKMMEALVNENKALDVETRRMSRVQAKNAFLQERSRLARKLQKENEEMEEAVRNLSPKVVHNTLLRSATSNPSSSDADAEGSRKMSGEDSEPSLRPSKPKSSSRAAPQNEIMSSMDEASPGSDQLCSPAWSILEKEALESRDRHLEFASDADMPRSDVVRTSCRSSHSMHPEYNCFPMGCIFRRSPRGERSGEAA